MKHAWAQRCTACLNCTLLVPFPLSPSDEALFKVCNDDAPTIKVAKTAVVEKKSRWNGTPAGSYFMVHAGAW